MDSHIDFVDFFLLYYSDRVIPRIQSSLNFTSHLCEVELRQWSHRTLQLLIEFLSIPFAIKHMCQLDNIASFVIAHIRYKYYANQINKLYH